MARCVLAMALIFFLLLTPAGPARAAAGPTDPLELGSFLDGVFAAQMQADHVAGAVVAVVKDGKVLYLKGMATRT